MLFRGVTWRGEGSCSESEPEGDERGGGSEELGASGSMQEDDVAGGKSDLEVDPQYRSKRHKNVQG
jgi:hypothetical protein